MAMVPFYVVYILTTIFFLSERWTLSWWCHLLSGWKLFYVLCGDWWKDGSCLVLELASYSLGDSDWSRSDYLLLLLGKGVVKSHCPFKSCLSLAQDWPWRPSPCPHSSSLGGWMVTPLPAGFLPGPFPYLWLERLPRFPFPDLDMLGFVSALSGDSCRCNSHTGINLPVNVK